MKKVEFGIGFIAGRKNVCNIINSYYKDIQEQLGDNTNVTFFILYDLKYTNCTKEDFYNIQPEVYQSGATVRYIGEEEIDIEKEIIQEKYNLSAEEAHLFLGHGYARARNTIMYFALKNKIDYLLFWDDDEYPVACIQKKGKILWRKQNNIKEHMKHISKVNITFGYRCGYNSPVPHVELSDEETAKCFKNFIDGVSNEAVSWKKVKESMENDGITYADETIMNEKKQVGLYRLGVEEWLLGSGLCINFKDIKKVPAFYNPPNARGEDTFFSTLLSDAKVVRVPTYHFHDGFLKYTQIMQEKYPTKLEKIKLDDKVEKRFYDACIGWTKYKPLLLYITNKQDYQNKIKETHDKLAMSIPKINQLFPNYDFSILLQILEEYNANVTKHYKEYIRINNIWNKIKTKVGKEELVHNKVLFLNSVLTTGKKEIFQKI